MGEIRPVAFSITVHESLFGSQRVEPAAKPAAEGIETLSFFIPLHRVPFYRRETAARGDCLPVSERSARRGPNLPVQGDIGEAEAEAIARAIGAGARPAAKLVQAGAAKSEALVHRN